MLESLPIPWWDTLTVDGTTRTSLSEKETVPLVELVRNMNVFYRRLISERAPDHLAQRRWHARQWVMAQVHGVGTGPCSATTGLVTSQDLVRAIWKGEIHSRDLPEDRILPRPYRGR